MPELRPKAARVIKAVLHLRGSGEEGGDGRVRRRSIAALGGVQVHRADQHDVLAQESAVSASAARRASSRSVSPACASAS